jgi:hypothetical protein
MLHKVLVQQSVGVACFATLHFLGQAVLGWSFLPSYKSGSSGACGDSGVARVQEGMPIGSFGLPQQYQSIGLVLQERGPTRSSREILTMDFLNFLAVDFGNAPSQPDRIAAGVVGNSIPDWLNNLAEQAIHQIQRRSSFFGDILIQ